MSQILCWIWSKKQAKRTSAEGYQEGVTSGGRAPWEGAWEGFGGLSRARWWFTWVHTWNKSWSLNWPPVPFTVHVNDKKKKKCLTYLQNPKALRYGQRGLPAFFPSLASRTPAVNWYSSDGILASALSKYRKTPTAWHELLSVSSKTDLVFLPPCFAREPLKSGWIKKVDYPYQSEQ